ncbi:tyrosine-type recombinase/integrase [Actinotalea sp.]|uniref:tyrosine-type recombinase/integrase n=1 Tax=Actinotalea sp. TaxID=1872145 RepID=UPI002B5DA51A|nr:tyrosine-type recombinase/integrase [Actinotalea sp.]HQY32478.1 tyrosine-type recombinase/integrase [Actinotalea sp.]HRA50071.1 tyrosine-type recombinase/integrase [Actinotalea sp.]
MTTRRHRRASGAVRKLPSGRWQARYTGPDGAMRTLGTYPTKVEADKGLAHEVSRMARGVWHDPRLGDQPVGEWFRGWIATRGDLAPSTRSLYATLLERWIDAELPLGGTRPRTVRLGAQTLASLTPADVREWDAAVLAEAGRRAAERWRRAASSPRKVNAAIRAWAATEGRPVASTGRIPGDLREAWLVATEGAVSDPRADRSNLGHTEAAQAYRLLHTGLAQAVSDGLIPANPCAVKGAGQRDSRHRTERRVLGPEELWPLVDAMPERYRAAVVVSVLSGLRAGELFALQRRNVDLAAGTVRVERSLARPGTGGGRYAGTKSRAALRTVTLPTAAVEALIEHMARFTPEQPTALVFGTSSGRPLGSGSRTTMFGRARTAIGRDDLTWHDLRHSAMTLVALTGATLPELMQRAGHSTPRASLHYQHAADDAQARIARRLSVVLADTGAPWHASPASSEALAPTRAAVHTSSDLASSEHSAP